MIQPYPMQTQSAAPCRLASREPRDSHGSHPIPPQALPTKCSGLATVRKHAVVLSFSAVVCVAGQPCRSRCNHFLPMMSSGKLDRRVIAALPYPDIFRSDENHVDGAEDFAVRLTETEALVEKDVGKDDLQRRCQVSPLRARYCRILFYIGSTSTPNLWGAKTHPKPQSQGWKIVVSERCRHGHEHQRHCPDRRKIVKGGPECVHDQIL